MPVEARDAVLGVADDDRVFLGELAQLPTDDLGLHRLGHHRAFRLQPFIPGLHVFLGPLEELAVAVPL